MKVARALGAAALLFGVCAASVHATQSTSFRSQSLSPTVTLSGGTVDPLADILADEYSDFNRYAVDALDAAGNRLYGGMSNLGSGTHNFGAAGGSDSLVGFLTQAFGYKAGLIVNQSVSDTSANTITTTIGLEPGPSQMSTVLTESLDDETTVSGRSDFRLLLARPLGGMDVGLGVGTVSTVATDSQVIRATTRTKTKDGLGNLTTDQTQVTTTESAKASSTTPIVDYKSRTIDFDANVRRPFMGGRLTIGAELQPISYSGTRTGSGSTMTLRAKHERSTTLFGYGAVRRSSGEFSTSSTSSTDTQRTVATTDNREAVGNTQTIIKTTNLSEPKTTSNPSGITLKTGAEVALNSSTRLAVGAVLAQRTATDTTEIHSPANRTIIERTDLSGGTVNNATSYTETTTQNWADTRTTESRTLAVILPVGLETQLTSKLSLQMGAAAKLFETGSKTVTTKYGAGEEKTARVYRDGTTPAPTTSTRSAYEVSDTTPYSDADVTLSSGIRYALNENITFDAQNFTNLTDLSGWQVQTTVRF